MKDPPSFSRLVDLPPVEPSRGPSLVKVNTNSRQCVSRSCAYFPLSPTQFIYISLTPSSRSRLDSKSIFFFRLEASTVPLSITSLSSRRGDTIALSPRLFFFSPADRSKNYSFFPDSVCIEFIRHVRLLSSTSSNVSAGVKLTRDQWQMSFPRKGRTTFRCKLVPNEVVGINHRVPVIEITRSTGCTR